MTRKIADIFLPKLVDGQYLIAKCLLMPLFFFRMFYKGEKNRTTKLCLESGIKGWELIEYNEIYRSACEFLSVAQVHKIAIDREGDYFSQMKSDVLREKPTHYVYDPRTGSNKHWRGIIQAFQVSWLLYRHRITPIAIVPDFPNRLWRAQASIVTAFEGVILIFMPPKVVHSSFTHRRVIGPNVMPLSQQTLDHINDLATKKPKRSQPNAVFAGSFYEPRTSILNEIKRRLNLVGLDLEFQGRTLGTARGSNDEYWSKLVNADILVTPADQVIGAGMDRINIPHFLYRYIEATSCGTLLIASNPPGISRYFTPGVHFVPFETPEDAAEKIKYYLKNEAERNAIAKAGKLRAEYLIRGRVYWTTIDAYLGKNSLT